MSDERGAWEAGMDRAVERADPHDAGPEVAGRRNQAALKLQAPGAPASRLAGMLDGVFRDRWRILIPIAVVLLATGVAELLVTPRFTADAELLVLPRPGSPDEAVGNEIGILRSRPLAEAVVEAIGPQRLYPGTGAAGAVQRFAASLDAHADPAGNVIVLRFSHDDPGVAAQAVNRAIAVYVATRARLYDNDRQRVLAAQVAGLGRRLDAAEQAYSAFTAAHGSHTDIRIDLLLHRQDGLAHDLDQADIDLDQARTRTSADAPKPDRLRAEQELQAATVRRADIAAQGAQVTGAIASLEAQEPAFIRLRRQRDLAAASYQAGAQALDQSRLAGNTGPGAATVRVLQAAAVPRQSQQLRLLILAAGVATSLLAGLVTAILCATLRRGYTGPGRIERDLGLPVLTSIDEWPADAPQLALERDARLQS